MGKYNYFENICEDIREYIRENNLINPDAEDLLAMLWTEDSVTGNGSGSYTFSACQAKEYLQNNLQLLEEAMNEFGYCIKIQGQDFDTCKTRLPKRELERIFNDQSSSLYDGLPNVNIWDKGAEWCDVTIRCHLLSQCIDSVLKNNK